VETNIIKYLLRSTIQCHWLVFVCLLEWVIFCRFTLEKKVFFTVFSNGHIFHFSRQKAMFFGFCTSKNNFSLFFTSKCHLFHLFTTKGHFTRFCIFKGYLSLFSILIIGHFFRLTYQKCIFSVLSHPHLCFCSANTITIILEPQDMRISEPTRTRQHTQQQTVRLVKPLVVVTMESPPGTTTTIGMPQVPPMRV